MDVETTQVAGSFCPSLLVKLRFTKKSGRDVNQIYQKELHYGTMPDGY